MLCCISYLLNDVMLNYLVPMSFQRYPRYPQIPEKQYPSKISFFFGSFVFLIGLLFTIVSLNIYNPSLVPNELRIISLNKKANVLILGCDEIFEGGPNKPWKGRSDTIILLHCNPQKNILNILNIPRDTKIRIPGHGLEKINYLNSIGGPIFTKKCIEKLLKIKIDSFVIVNVKGINKIIDEIGGIVVDVPGRMEYKDYTGMLDINLQPGEQILNGDQAVGFVRFRHDSLGDIGRIQRQQIFIRAFIKKLMDPITFTKLPEIISIYKKTIFTDLKTQDIIKIANFIRNVPNSNQNTVILPGDFGRYNKIGYWIPDQNQISLIVRKFFNEEKIVSRFKQTKPSEIKVSIFNGSKKDNLLATKLAVLLRERGYTILLCDDYGSEISKTKIYAQKANSETALQVKKDLKNTGELLIGNLGPPDSDVTILAGDDLLKLVAKVTTQHK